MRITAVLVAGLFGVFPVTGQNFDLSKWTVERMTGTGSWIIDSPRSRTRFVNATLADREVFYSDGTVVVINFRIRVATAIDDDFIGFVLGFQPGDGSNPNADYLLVDWKQGPQSFGNWGSASAGLAVSRVTGVGTAGTNGGTIDFWSHTGVVSELARGTRFGRTGWRDNTEYRFSVIFTPANLLISVNGQPEFNLTGTFNMGRFGCYNFSQSQTVFQFPVLGSFLPYGMGCSGAAGTPTLSAAPPMLGENFNLQVANLPPNGAAMLVLGVSRSVWGGIPLPFDMGLIGGTGCTLYASAEFLLPLTNANGNGTMTLRLPNDPLLLQFPFYCQATGIDPTANGLGMVVSNAAAGRAGIQ